MICVRQGGFIQNMGSIISRGRMFAGRRGESDCMGSVCLAEWGDEGSWDAGRLGEGEVWM